MSAQTPRLAALSVILALVGTLGSSFATPPGPGASRYHPVERSFPGRLLGFLENGEVIVTANGGLQYWDVTSGHLRDSRDLEVGWSIALSPGGSTLAELLYVDSEASYRVRLMDVASGEIVETDLTTDLGGPLTFSPDGATLACRTSDGISLLAVATGRVRDVLPDSIHEDRPEPPMAFSPDGSLLATSFSQEDLGEGGLLIWEGGVRIWDLAAGRLQSTISTSPPWGMVLAFSPDGETLGTADGLWDVASGQRLITFDFAITHAFDVAFSPDGATLATIGEYEVGLWDKDGRWKARLFSGWIGEDVAYSPDGSRLACTVEVGAPTWEAVVLVWDLMALPPRRPARGEVVLVDSLGSPIPDTELTVGQNDFRSWLTRTDSEGRAPLAVSRQGLHEVQARGGRGWRSIPLLPDRPFTLTLEASGGVERGDGMLYEYGVSPHDLLRSWRLEGFPVHRIEVEAQVLGLPEERESYERHVLRLQRAISGQSEPPTWISELDSTGHARLPIATVNRASGLYRAWVGARESPSGSWHSLPLNQGRRYRLELPVGRPARITSLGAMKTAMPPSLGSSLGPNIPNPFNENTQIPYHLIESGLVRLEIYNALGQRVRTLVDGFREAGLHRVEWDARDHHGSVVASGVYLARLTHLGGVRTRRLLLLR